MIRAIIFDCFGVLTTDTWRAFTATLPAEQRLAASELNRAYDAGFTSLEEFLQGVQELTGRQPQLVERLIDHEITKNTQLLAYIRDLKPRYKIGMISNIASNWIRDSFLTSDEQALFDDMIFSYKVRLAKPDRRIFELAAKQLGVAPDECVFIDDVETYCEAATEVGMATIVYSEFDRMRQRLEATLSQSE